MGCMAVGRNSRECWPSGGMQGSTRRKDSYIGHPLPFLWHEGSPRVTGYFPQYKKPHMDTNTKTRSRQRNGDHAQGSRRRLVSPSPTRRKQRKRGGKRRSGCGGQRHKNEKSRQAVQEVLQSMLMELCKCQQTRHCPGEDGLRLWCMSTRNKDMPKSPTSASRLHSHPEAWRPLYGNSSPEQSRQDSILTELG